MERQEKVTPVDYEPVGVNDLKNLMMKLVNQAFRDSFDKGKKKYGDRWKTTSWSGVTNLADSKWDMFLHLAKAGSVQEIEHHASDMMAWLTIIALRGIHEYTSDPKSVTLKWEDFARCDEIQDDCFLDAIDLKIDAGYVVTAVIPKKIPEGILDYLLDGRYDREAFRVVIE